MLGPVGAVAAAYYVVARLGLVAAVAQPVVSSAWPPTGLALAILLLFGLRLWPGIAIGAFLLNWTSGVPAVGAAAIAVGNTLEAVIPAVLLGRLGFRPSLERIRDVLALALLGALASTTVSATIGVATLWATGGVAPGGVEKLWVVWWSGDAMGDLLVAPLLLTWWPLRRERRWVSAIVAGLVLVAGAELLIRSGSRYVYPLFPLAIWAAVLLGSRGTATASVVVAVLAVRATLSGIGPFAAGADVATNLAQVQLFVAVFSVSGLLLAALGAERETALRAAREAERHNRLLAEEARASERHNHVLAEEARASGEAFRLLVEGVRDCAIFWLDALGRVVNWNAGAQNLKGYAADEILGQSYSRFFRREDVANGAPARELQRATETGVCQVEGWRVRKDGSLFWADVQLSAVRDENGTLLGFAKLVRDLSERRRAQEQLRREATFVQLLQNVAVAANQATSVEEALQAALDDICRVICWPVGHLWLTRPDGKTELHSTGLWHEDDAALNAPFRQATEGCSVCAGVGLPGQVLERRRAVWIMNLAQEPAFVRSDAAVTSGLRAAFAFPVWLGDEVAGVLEFFARRPVAPDDSLLDVMAHVGTQLGRVIERARATQALRRPEAGAQAGRAVEGVDTRPQSGQRLATDLGPGMLDQLGLPAAIRWQAREFQAHTGIGCALDLRVEDELTLDDTRATAAFRILQEALTNVARHSGATGVRIHLGVSPRELRLTVTDNGRGISETALRDERSRGLLGLHERAATLGGTVSIEGTAGQGTTVSLTLPRRSSPSSSRTTMT